MFTGARSEHPLKGQRNQRKPQLAGQSEGASIMNTTTPTQLSNRDRAVLRAIAAGRCTVSGNSGAFLTIDGLYYSDQFAGARLTNAGLIARPGPEPAMAHLTQTGQAILQAA
jgi:hypothetical protein